MRSPGRSEEEGNACRQAQVLHPLVGGYQSASAAVQKSRRCLYLPEHVTSVNAHGEPLGWYPVDPGTEQSGETRAELEACSFRRQVDRVLIAARFDREADAEIDEGLNAVPRPLTREIHAQCGGAGRNCIVGRPDHLVG